MSRIDSIEALRALYGHASGRAVEKEFDRLDRHFRGFIEKSPFVLLSTAAPGGLPDVSPKGDQPGFVLALDDKRLAIPDRPGNRRMDSFQNIIENPVVGLLFLIPGMDETLRVNGRAEIRVDEDLMDRFVHEGKRPISVLVVTIEEIYFHCAKAFMRSSLWKPESWPDRSTLPTLGAMLKDQIGIAKTAREVDSDLAENYRASLY